MDLAQQILNTEPGRGWLSQFDHNDQGIALDMVKHLEFIPTSEVNSRLADLIEENVSHSESTALFCSRKLPYERDPVTSERRYKQYFQDDENGRIILTPAQSDGSEGIIGNLIQNESRNKAYLLDHPSIQRMKDSRVKKVIIVDDIISTGDRVSKFLDSFLRHPSMKSWFSLITKVVVLSYVQFENSENSIKQYFEGSHVFKKFDKISFVSHRTNNENFSDNSYIENMFRSLCEDYGQRFGIKKDRLLGYGNIFSNIVFEHSCPNNCPGILHYKNDYWLPLFPKRGIPSDIKALISGVDPDSYDHQRIADLLEVDIRAIDKTLLPESERLYLVLIALSTTSSIKNYNVRIKRVSKLLNISIESVCREMKLAKQEGLIDHLNLPTEAVRESLELIKKSCNLKDNKISFDRTFHYMI